MAWGINKTRVWNATWTLSLSFACFSLWPVLFTSLDALNDRHSPAAPGPALSNHCVQAGDLRKVVTVTQTWNKSSRKKKGTHCCTQINELSVTTCTAIFYKSIFMEFNPFPYGTLSSFIHPHICLHNKYLITRLLGARYYALRCNHRNEKDRVTHSEFPFILKANYSVKTNPFVNKKRSLMPGCAPSEAMKTAAAASRRPPCQGDGEFWWTRSSCLQSRGDIIQWILLQTMTGKCWYNITLNDSLECGEKWLRKSWSPAPWHTNRCRIAWSLREACERPGQEKQCEASPRPPFHTPALSPSWGCFLPPPRLSPHYLFLQQIFIEVPCYGLNVCVP